MTTTDRRPAQSPPRPAATSPGWASFQSLSKAMIKGFLRDKASLFFTMLFPLMFLVIFGLLFGNQGTSRTEIGVVGDGPVIQALSRSPAVEVKRPATVDEALAQVRDGDLPGFVAEQGDRVTLRFAISDQAQAGIVQGIVGGVVNDANIAATGQQPRFALDAAQVEDQSLKPIQYLTPGILAWAASTAAVFGSATTFVSWRKKQVLRRLRLAPVQPMTVLGSRISVSLGIALAQFVVFVGVALLPVFGLRLSGQWWWSIPLLLLGTLAFFSVGMLVGAFCKTEEAASAVANIVVLPMAFLSGTFFPIDNAPAWLRAVSQVLPMRHLNDGMSDVMVRGKGIAALGVPALVLVGFAVVLGAVAAKVFRWEED